MTASTATPPRARLVALLGCGEEVLAEALDVVAGTWGEVDVVSPVLRGAAPADHDGEAEPVRLVSCRPLAAWKCLDVVGEEAAALTERLRARGGRVEAVLVTSDQVVRMTAHAAGHRIYVGRGHYAEIVLLWGPAGFTPLAWTPPVYARPDVRDVCQRVRERLVWHARVTA